MAPKNQCEGKEEILEGIEDIEALEKKDEDDTSSDPENLKDESSCEVEAIKAGEALKKGHIGEYMIFFWLGNTALMAWNMFINALDIYIKLMPHKDIGVNITRAYNIPGSITSLILCFIKPTNYFVTLCCAMTGIIITMIISPILLSVNLNEDSLYWGSLIVIGLLSISSAIVYSSSFSFATKYDPKAVASVSSGLGCSGVLSGLVRIITKAAFDGDDQLMQTSISYFVIAILIVIATLIYLVIKNKQPAIKASLHASKEELETTISFEAAVRTFKIIWIQWVSISINFFITLLMFPGYVSRVKASKVIGDWTYVLITFIFCIFDWIGRYLPTHWIWPSIKWSFFPALFRTLFFIIFMLPIEGIIEVGNPVWTIVWQIPFAISNGYFDTVNIIYGSCHKDLDHDGRRIAGFMVCFAVNFGILMSMFVSYGLPPPHY